MKYIDEIQKGMDLLASYNAMFIGQAVAFKGTSLTNQVKNYPANRLIELPVAEEFQMGFCIGLALRGQIPVSMYPRSNFAILACNQIVNHLDKWRAMGGDDVKVIIKIAVGSSYPLDPGEQHKANYAQAFKDMCTSIKVYDLLYPQDIYPAYEKALKYSGSSILIEHADLYKVEL
jgi:acetoin:2,6-dichlorophenolindophenol oxidoreductase subunit beta